MAKAKKEEIPKYVELAGYIQYVLIDEDANNFDSLAALEVVRSMILSRITCPHSNDQNNIEDDDPEPAKPPKKTKHAKAVPEVNVAGYC